MPRAMPMTLAFRVASERRSGRRREELVGPGEEREATKLEAEEL